MPLDDAARIAGWCHSGHCADTSTELPELIGRRRAEVAERIASLQALDARLAALERHLVRPGRALAMLAGPGAACCDAAGAVVSGAGAAAARVPASAERPFSAGAVPGQPSGRMSSQPDRTPRS